MNLKQNYVQMFRYQTKNSVPCIDFASIFYLLRESMLQVTKIGSFLLLAQLVLSHNTHTMQLLRLKCSNST